MLGILCMENVSRVNIFYLFSSYEKNSLEKIDHFRTFVVDNHINVYPSNYRGRPVTTTNIQDYISNIVSKYLPVGLPPWQICVIPVIAPTTSATRTEDITSIPSTSASGNDTEEEQPSSSDSTAPVRYFSIATTIFIKFKIL